ncbi:hypothetical protein CCR75_008248 [Bremia lactucae]|uniref:SUN domain-containing protein n=1 Tax=Bremia lactucae TaxID=4779 RepID=A0A976IGN3_BRELC|nr:hypothetical protein CCR75_008248 [Bremia lactucae]
MSVLLLLLLALYDVWGIVTPETTSNPSDESIVSSDETTVLDMRTEQSEPLTDPIPVIPDTDASLNFRQMEERDDLIAKMELVDEDVDPLLDVPNGLFEVVDVDSVDNRKRQNYASLDAGATILDASPETKSPTNLLVPDKDRYMLIPCSNPRKWVVISLSEDVHADAIEVANYEKFSSPVKDFIVLGSVNYPTDTWLVLGNFTATHTNGEQIYQLDAQQHVRYIKFRILSHYGSEYYCTLSQLRVFGRTFTQVISQLEKSIDAEVDALDETGKTDPKELNSPDSAEVLAPRLSDLTDLTSQCLMEKNNTVVAIFYDERQQVKHYGNNGMCCLVDHTLEQIDAELDATSSSSELTPIASSDNINPEAGKSSGESPVTSPTGASSSTTNASNVVSANSPNANVTASSISKPSSPLVQTSPILSASPNQGLGRLESIFVRITKKIQALEVNQSVMAKQIEEHHKQQWAAVKNLQFYQNSLDGQLEEIRSTILELVSIKLFPKEDVAKDSLADKNTLLSHRQLLDEIRRDNIALRSEMLIVREIITTMKVGILCAIILSGFIILFYLLRLLFRCVSKCKERANLREWFWRMENHEGKSISRSESAVIAAGALCVNRNAQFGSSWDDSAIERKTLVSDMVSESRQQFRRHRTKRASQSSTTLHCSRK